MANESNPHWATVWDLGLKTCALFGIVFVYFTHGCEFNRLQSQITKNEIALKEATNKLTEAQTQLASKQGEQINRELTSRIVVTTDLDQPFIAEPLQEVRLKLKIANEGSAPAVINGAEVEVFRGNISTSARSLVEKAREILAVEKQLQLPLNPLDANTPNLLSDLQKRWDELHKNCPHGALLLVNEGGGDIDWSKVTTLRKAANCTLPSGQSMRVEFVLMSTHFYNHPIWLRLEPNVTIANTKQRFGELLLPIQPTSQPQRYAATTSYFQPQVVPSSEQSGFSDVPILPTTTSEAVPPTQ